MSVPDVERRRCSQGCMESTAFALADTSPAFSDSLQRLLPQLQLSLRRFQTCCIVYDTLDTQQYCVSRILEILLDRRSEHFSNSKIAAHAETCARCLYTCGQAVACSNGRGRLRSGWSVELMRGNTMPDFTVRLGVQNL
eukprot:2631040-Amphidinium_carterae.1